MAERFSTKLYGPQRERMSHLEGLNGAQSTCCFVWALLVLGVMRLRGQLQPGETAPWHAYWKTGITNSLGPAFGMVALKNITYSAQVRGWVGGLISPATAAPLCTVQCTRQRAA